MKLKDNLDKRSIYLSKILARWLEYHGDTKIRINIDRSTVLKMRIMDNKNFFIYYFKLNSFLRFSSHNFSRE